VADNFELSGASGRGCTQSDDSILFYCLAKMAGLADGARGWRDQTPLSLAKNKPGFSLPKES
jgi:hypothetical protein